MKKIFVLGLLITLFLSVSGYCGEIIQITSNNLRDYWPIVNSQGHVFWNQYRVYSEPSSYCVYSLMYFNGTTIIEAVTKTCNGSECSCGGTMPSFTPFSGYGDRHQTDGNSIVYLKTVGGYSQIFLFDGQKEIQITNTNYPNGYPSICNGYIVWEGSPGGGTVDNSTAEIFLYKPEPTVATISEIKATPSNEKVTLQWTTESEIDNAGFNFWRTEEYQKINASLIPAKGSPTEGASYTFIDKNVQNRKTYLYKLEDIDLSGNSTFHGPVDATPRIIY